MTNIDNLIRAGERMNAVFDKLLLAAELMPPKMVTEIGAAQRDWTHYLLRVQTESRDPKESELAKKIASECARAAIESHCIGGRADGPVFWWDLSQVDDDASVFVEESVAYLELTSAIHRHPSNADLVSFPE